MDCAPIFPFRNGTTGSRSCSYSRGGAWNVSEVTSARRAQRLVLDLGGIADHGPALGDIEAEPHTEAVRRFSDRRTDIFHVLPGKILGFPRIWRDRSVVTAEIDMHVLILDHAAIEFGPILDRAPEDEWTGKPHLLLE